MHKKVEAAAGGWPPSGQPLPDPPEDQSQEQDRHPLTYDYNRQGAVIVVHAHSLPWSWRSRPLDRLSHEAKRLLVKFE